MVPDSRPPKEGLFSRTSAENVQTSPLRPRRLSSISVGEPAPAETVRAGPRAGPPQGPARQHPGHRHAAIRSLARRGGVKRISGLIYQETRGVLKVFLENVIRDAKRKTCPPWTWRTPAKGRAALRLRRPTRSRQLEAVSPRTTATASYSTC